MAEKHFDYNTEVPKEYRNLQDRVEAVKAEIAACNLPPIIKDGNSPKSSQDLREEALMESFIQELKSKGDRRAKGQVGNPTTLETDRWRIIVTNQSGIGEVVVASYILPESLKWPNHKRIFSYSQIGSIEKAIGSSGFDSSQKFEATKQLLRYENRVVPVPLNNPSPTQLCRQELNCRMAEI